MARRRTTAALVLPLLALVLAGCGLTDEEAGYDRACSQAIRQADRAVAARVEALARTVAVTDVSPERVAETLGHQDDVQRAVFGPIAAVTSRAARQGQDVQRLTQRCEQGPAAPPRTCQRALALAANAARTTAAATDARVDAWSEQLVMARSAFAADRPATEAAIDRWDALMTDYERSAVSADRTRVRLATARSTCRAALD